MNPDSHEEQVFQKDWDEAFTQTLEIISHATHIIVCTEEDHVPDLVQALDDNPLRALILIHLASNLGTWRDRARSHGNYPYPDWRDLLTRVNARMDRSGYSIDPNDIIELGRMLDLSETLAAQKNLDRSQPKVVTYLRFADRLGEDPCIVALALLSCGRVIRDFDQEGAPRRQEEAS